MDGLLKADLAEVTVLKSVDRWYGVTYKEDKETVVKAIKDLKDKACTGETLGGTGKMSGEMDKTFTKGGGRGVCHGWGSNQLPALRQRPHQ